MKCPHCGTIVPEGDLFCGNCGQRMIEPAPAPLPAPTQAPPQVPPPPAAGKKSAVPWVIAAVVVVGLCLICGGGGAAVYFLRPTPTPTWTATPTPLPPPPTVTSTPVLAPTRQATPTPPATPTSQAISTPSLETLRFEDAYMGVQAIYPADWVVVEEYAGESVFIAESAAAYDDPSSGPWIYVMNMGAAASLSEVAELTLDEFRVEGVAISDPMPVTVQGSSAEVYTLAGYLTEEASAPVQAYLLLTLDQGVGVAFMYGTAQADWETEGPMLEQLAAGAVRIPMVAAPTINSLVFAAQVDDDGNPVGISDTFPAGTTEVYGVFEYEGFGELAEYSVVFYRYWDGYETEGTLALPAGDAGQTWFRRSNEDGLWPGEYVVEIHAGEELLTLGFFDVEGQVLLEDDFSRADSGWKTWASETSEVAYEDGELRIHVIKDNWTAYATYGSLEDNSFDNFAVEADVWLTQIPEEGSEVGLVLRRNDKNYYQLVLSNDGLFKIRMHTDEGWTTLVDWVESAAINAGVEAINRMRAECDGSTLRFYVNSIYLDEITDTTLTSGQVGLMAGSYTGGSDVYAVFDDVVIYAFP